jgi:acyl carrier protein
MTNLEKYNASMIEALTIDQGSLIGLTYQSISSWDSVGHMNLIASLEDAFDIMLETDDIVDFSSYEAGMEILKKYGIEF